MRALRFLNKYFFKYKWYLLLGAVFIVLTNIAKVKGPVVIKDAMDELDLKFGEEVDLLSPEFAQDIFSIALIAGLAYIAVYLIQGVFLFMTRMSIIVMSRHIEFDLKNEIYRHYQRLDMGFYKANRTGDLMNRISEDVSKVRMYLGPAVMYSINLLVLFIVGLTQMLAISPKLTLYSLIPLPIMSVMIYFVSSIMNKKAERVQKQQSRLSTMVQETFSGIRVLKAYSREDYSNTNFNSASEEYRKRSLSQVKVNALFFPIIMLLIGLSTILVIYIGGKMHIADPSDETGFTPGDIAAFIIYINMLTWPFASVGWVTSLAQQAAASQERINEFLKQKPTITNPSNVPMEIAGKIEFRDVSFTYADSGIKALDNISFTIEPGETLAIIGRTGSGKSTITHLATRQYDVTAGQVLIDDQPIDTVNLDAVRNQIGYVPQDVFLFSDTITNNIAFGIERDGNEKERVEQAAKDAVIYDNIAQFPKAFDTVLGERGVTLSGGQKQRISIARALVRNPRILIFDDCLSAVDTETEERILQNLRRLMQGKSTILISHRVSTVKGANHILVMDEGKVVESGTHDELQKLDGVYAELYHKQLLEDESI